MSIYSASANSATWNPIWGLLFFAAVFLALGIYAYFLHNKDRFYIKPDGDEEETEEKPPVPEKDSISNTSSLDSDYAANCSMWVCPFCETLNPYPEGIEPAKKPEPIVTASIAGKTGLRGTLISNMKQRDDKKPVERPSLVCCACGKQH